MANNKDFKVKNSIQPTVYQEAVGTVVSATQGYYISGASYDSVSFDFSSQFSYPFAFGFADSGTKMYGLKSFNGGTLYQYTLSTAYDISTASYANKSYSFANGDSGFVITPDGSSLYISANDGDAVYRYTFGTAFDASTLSNGTQMFSTSSVDTQPDMCKFNNDGSKFFLLGRSNNRIYEYSVSTAYDLTTATYSNNSLLVSAQAAGPLGFDFSADGTSLVVSDNTTDSVYLYTLTTGYDLTKATYSGTNFSVASQDSVPGGMSFVNNGSKLLILGRANSLIYQYSTALSTAQLDLSTGSVFDYTPTSDVQVTLTNPAASGTSSGATLLLTGGVASTYDIGNAVYSNKSLDVSSQVTGSMGLKGITFNNNGTSLYILTGDAGVSTNDAVYQYTLSTAFDISTGSYANKTLNVGTRETTPTGLSFNTDGTKLFIIGYNDDLVETWSLSSGYDISTASYASQSFNISSQEDYARHINFNNNGTKMYITGNGSSRVQEYALSTAFNVTTASFTDNFNPTSQASAPFVTLFNSDGTKMYVQQSTGILYQYSLSTAFDVSTGSYDNISFTLTEGGGYQGLFIGNSGLSLYSASNDDSKVYQYSTAAPATITYDSTLQWSGGTAPTSPATVETDVITFNTTDGGTTYKSALAIDGAK